MLRHRVPLTRKKSLRQKLIENGKLKDFLQNHQYNIGSKYFPSEATTLMSDQPLQNFLDVSVWAGSGSAPRTWPSGEKGVPGVWEDGPALQTPRQQ